MKKEVLLVVGILLVGLLMVSGVAASVYEGSISSEFGVGVEGEFPGEDVQDYDSDEVSDSNNWFLISLVVLALILGIVYFRKVNKGKVSRKRKVKKK